MLDFSEEQSMAEFFDSAPKRAKRKPSLPYNSEPYGSKPDYKKLAGIMQPAPKATQSKMRRDHVTKLNWK
jgi:hypothetical protein